MLRFNFKEFFCRAARYTLHVFLPRVCFSCGCDLRWDSTAFLCPSCQAGLTLPGPLICKRCGVTLKSGGAHCYHCRGSKSRQYQCAVIRSACNFNQFSRGLIHALKYQGIDYVAPYMGGLMAQCFSKFDELQGVNLVIPVPLFKKRKNKRGYNQSELLARVLARQLGLKLDTTSLIRVRDTVSQTKLGRQERISNMQDAFKVKQTADVRGKNVLLVDDVATTGATLEGCARALRKAGAKRVVAYTFSREN